MTFLGSLRRDGLAFAILAAMVMLAGYLQPLAEAKAANGPYAGVICSTFGAAKAGPDGSPVDPASADDCPLCVASAGSAPLLLPVIPVAVSPCRAASPVRWTLDAEQMAVRLAMGVQPIRGPPSIS